MSAPIIAGYNFTLSVEGQREFAGTVRSVRSRRIAFGVATLVAALLVGGGLHFDSPAMMWSGVAVVVVEGMVYFALKKVRERCKPAPPHLYRCITHNPGVSGWCLNKPWAQGCRSGKEVVKPRQEQFKRTILSHYVEADLAAIQESGTAFPDTFLREAIPSHEFCQNPVGIGEAESTIEADTLVGWNKEKFTLLGKGTITYRPLVGQTKDRNVSLSSQFVLLRDKETGKNVIFISAHIDGFHLVDAERGATGSGKPTTETGDGQLSEIIHYLKQAADKYDVDQVIIGMDANCDPSLGPSRFDILRRAGYVVSSTPPNTKGTFWDGGLRRPITMDYIACWARGDTPTVITHNSPDELTYENPEGIGDHTAICVAIYSGALF